jgi:hypothetical protein
MDRTDRFPVPLISQDGHLGRIYHGGFQDILTRGFYFGQYHPLWDMQPTVLAYAQATDSLSGSNYYGEFLALDEDGNGVIDDLEQGKPAVWDCGCAVGGIATNILGKGEVEHGGFFQNSRILKYADPNWNKGGVSTLGPMLDQMATAVALQLAYGPEATDPFFGIAYGMGTDGMPKWPSLQFARYALELTLIYQKMYPSAAAKGTGFTLYVPPSVPYFPYAGYNPYGIANVVASNDPTKIFTAEFADGEVW